tara:strand:- start:173 stop:493 length:321 start_codon:yes stop_codon:yes gene_type:complete
MSLKWPNKDPDEILDYSIDWSRFIGSATLSTAAWSVDNADGVKTTLVASGPTVHGIQLVSSTLTNTVVTARVSLGTDNVRYKFYCTVTTSDGLTFERTVLLRVREK